MLLTLSAGVDAAERQKCDDRDSNAYLESVETISQSSNYHGWPTVTKSSDSELLLTYSGGREWHIGPFGRIELRRSSDNGKTWSDAEIVVDSILDDRDAGITQSSKGTLLITWFTSTAWISRLEKAEKLYDEVEWIEELRNETSNKEFRRKYEWPQEKIQRWQEMRRVIDAQEYRYQSIKSHFENGTAGIAQWMIRSEDNGKTWSEPYFLPMMSPHGPITTSDGRLLFAGKWDGDGFVGLSESTDDGRTWNMVSRIQPMQGHDSGQYHELHIVEAADKTLIVHIRNHNETYESETLQSESRDGGKTWTEPHSIGVWGHPSHLLRLEDNRLLMTYSYRGSQRKPSDNNRLVSRLSTDNGESWSEPIVIADNLDSWDFGYPTTVELDDNKLLTIWYEVQSGSPDAVLRQAIWENVAF